MAAQQAVEQQLTFVILSSFHGVCAVMLTSCMLVQDVSVKCA